MSCRRTRLQRLDLARILASSARPSSMSLLAAQLGLAHLQIRLAPRRRLHLVAEPVGGDQRVLQRPLALAEAAGALLEGRDLLLELRVLLQDCLVVLGNIVEEGVDLVDVEAPEPLDGELLLTNVERADAHRASGLLPDLGGDSVQHRNQELLQEVKHENHDHGRESSPT